jgi:enoyl-CoA hydratase
MGEPVLLLERAEGIATVTLNRPAHLNDETRAVILTGAGRAFCAGLDLKELGGETGGGTDIGAAVGRGANVVRAIERCPWPVIGAVNGYAITGGVELALACDLLIASTAARFADTHARVGIMPGWGLKRVIDDGFATTLREGLALEATANRTQAATLTPEQIAARRRSVQDRGRSQSG